LEQVVDPAARIVMSDVASPWNNCGAPSNSAVTVQKINDLGLSFDFWVHGWLFQQGLFGDGHAEKFNFGDSYLGVRPWTESRSDGTMWDCQGLN